MKNQIMNYTKEQKKNFNGVEEPWETITLYHGTTSRYLNTIIREGLTSRSLNKRNNFTEVPSNEELVYLTNRWHYWYAFNANQESLIEQVGEERFKNESLQDLWAETSDFPMYVTVEVPVELLTLDEDVVYQYNIKKGLRDGTFKNPTDISVEDCLAQGTVASLTAISPEYISDFGIIGSEKFRDDLLNGQYGADASRWFKGLGLGSSDLMEIMVAESMNYNNQNTSLYMEYPPEKMSLVKSVRLEEAGLTIKHED